MLRPVRVGDSALWSLWKNANASRNNAFDPQGPTAALFNFANSDVVRVTQLSDTSISVAGPRGSTDMSLQPGERATLMFPSSDAAEAPAGSLQLPVLIGGGALVLGAVIGLGAWFHAKHA